MDLATLAWSQEEFGTAALGDTRRVRRLVKLAALAALRPNGTITNTVIGSAEREGAFRFLENDAVAVSALGNATYGRTAERCADARLVIVPVDQGALSVTDPGGKRGFGPISSPHRLGMGINVMTSLAVDHRGGTLGVLDQQWWVRPRKAHRLSRIGSKRDPRRPEERETDYWLRTMRGSLTRLNETAPECVPWFQLDRGGDCHAVLAFAQERQVLLTVRLRGNRLVRFADGREKIIKPLLDVQRVDGYYHVEVPGRDGRSPRQARLAVRFMRVPIALRVTQKSECRRPAWFNVVLASEVHPPRGEAPITWLLATTRKVRTLEDALHVVAAYTLRWRLEDFHKTWKSGGCDIEASQLRAPDHYQRWATIMAAVAARIERLKYVSRAEPDRPATDEFTRDEIDVVLLLRKGPAARKYKPGDVPTIGEVTRWMAELGGYMKSRRASPPGSTVIRRGLEIVSVAVATMEVMRSSKKPRSG